MRVLLVGRSAELPPKNTCIGRWRQLMNQAIALSGHSGLTPAAFHTFLRVVISVWTSLSKASGVLDLAAAPWFAMRSLISESSRICPTSSASRLMIVRGVLDGASTPYQPWYSNPASPASAMVGTSGSAGARYVVVTPSANTLPLLTNGTAARTGERMKCTRPAIRSVSDSGEPRYGTCTALTPDASLNNSPA